MTMPGAIPFNPPQIGTTGVLPDPRARLFQALLEGLQAGEQIKDAKLRRAEAQAEKQSNQALGEAIRSLMLEAEQGIQLPAGSLPGAAGAMPLTVESPMAQTLRSLPAEAVPAFARVAGPIQQQRANDRAITKALQAIPDPSRREAVGVLLSLPDLPAEARNDLYERIAGITGTDPALFPKWLATWRTGVVTADQAARAVGMPLPPGIPPNLKVKASSGVPERDREMQRIARAMNGFNTLVDNADRRLREERRLINERVGGAYFKRTGTFASKDLENRALIDFNRRQAELFPKYQDWQERIAALQDQLTQTLEGNASQPQRPTEDPDELDRLINEALSRRRSAPTRP